MNESLQITLNFKSYPMLDLVVKYGKKFINVLCLILLLLGIFSGIHFENILIASLLIIISIAVFIVGQVLTELVILVTDMLLPK
ncbi:MAG: hypothetical protein WCJ99_00440 [Betaproteobacteria bacterium]|jgi:hypothetical protein